MSLTKGRITQTIAQVTARLQLLLDQLGLIGSCLRQTTRHTLRPAADFIYGVVESAGWTVTDVREATNTCAVGCFTGSGGVIAGWTQRTEGVVACSRQVS